MTVLYYNGSVDWECVLTRTHTHSDISMLCALAPGSLNGILNYSRKQKTLENYYGIIKCQLLDHKAQSLEETSATYVNEEVEKRINVI